MDDASVTKSVNDYNTLSMDLYLDALTAMTNMATSYSQNLASISALITEVNSIRDAMINDTNAATMNARIKTVEDSLAASSALLANSTTYMSYITDLYSKYNNILSNTTSVQVSYNLDPTAINKIVKQNQDFNLSSNPIVDLSVYGSNILTLMPYTNYYQHARVNQDPLTVSSDFSVYINDSTTTWSRGQVLELFIDSPILLDIYDFKIYTGIDANGVYQNLLVAYDASDFGTSANMPAIRVICLDPIAMTFVVDKIR